MAILYIVIMLVIVGLAVFYVIWEYVLKPKKQGDGLSQKVIKNKKQIESMTANVESILVYANGNDELCRRLVEVKDNIRFFNPTTNAEALVVDEKLAAKLDDLKIQVAKDNTQEVCFRMLEEVEAFVVQRRKEENRT